MLIHEPESAVARHAVKQGCLRAPPLSGLCVECPFKSGCTVPRVPLVLWTARITHDMGQAKRVFYFNELTQAPIGPLARTHGSRESHRTTCLRLDCGAVVLDPNALREPEDVPSVPRTMDLYDYLDLDRCPESVLMDARQVRYNQISNYGRKAILAVQTCSKECADRLSDAMNRNWGKVSNLLREIRPLKTPL